MSDAAGVRPRGRGTAHDLLVTYSAQIISLVLGVGASIVLARTLGPDGRGVIQIVRLLGVEASTLLSLGVGVSVVYFVARRELDVRRVVGTAMIFSHAIGLLILITLVLTAPIWADLFLSDVPNAARYVPAAGVLGWSLVVQGSVLGVYRGCGRFVGFAVWSVLTSATYAAALIWLLVIRDASIAGGVVAVAAANGTMALLMTVTCISAFGVSFADIGFTLKRLLTFNVAGHGGTILQEISYRMDVFLVALFLHTSAVGIYAVAVTSAQLMWLLPNAMGMIVLARTAADEQASADRRLISISQALFTALVIAAVVAAALAGFLIPLLYGRDFEPAVAPFVLLLPGTVALGSWKVIANHLAGRGSPKYKLHGALIGAALTVGLDLLLIPRWGLTGAAVATSVAYIASTLHIAVVAGSLMGVSPYRLFLIEAETYRLISNRVRKVAGGQASAGTAGSSPPQ